MLASTFGSIDPTVAIIVVAVIVTLTCLIVLYNQIKIATGTGRLPQPLEVKGAMTFATMGDHHRLEAKVDKNEINNNERHKAAKESRKEIHERVRGLESDVRQVKTENKAQTDALDLLSSDFREFRKEQSEGMKEILKRLP
ncbi:MAG: hypothetical protein AAF065_11970 [Verrucomicrobiota bacterium]